MKNLEEILEKFPIKYKWEKLYRKQKDSLRNDIKELIVEVWKDGNNSKKNENINKDKFFGEIEK